MAIDAMVSFVDTFEDGGGRLVLAEPRPGAIVGQPFLYFRTAPYEVTALNGLPVWGGATELMLGEFKIANRLGYTQIEFVDREQFLLAVAAWRRRDRRRA